MKGFSSKLIALKVAVLKDRKIYCLQARPCLFQPGNFTGCGSEGVNNVAETLTDGNKRAVLLSWRSSDHPAPRALSASRRQQERCTSTEHHGCTSNYV